MISAVFYRNLSIVRLMVVGILVTSPAKGLPTCVNEEKQTKLQTLTRQLAGDLLKQRKFAAAAMFKSMEGFGFEPLGYKTRLETAACITEVIKELEPSSLDALLAIPPEDMAKETHEFMSFGPGSATWELERQRLPPGYCAMLLTEILTHYRREILLRGNIPFMETTQEQEVDDRIRTLVVQDDVPLKRQAMILHCLLYMLNGKQDHLDQSSTYLNQIPEDPLDFVPFAVSLWLQLEHDQTRNKTHVDLTMRWRTYMDQLDNRLGGYQGPITQLAEGAFAGLITRSMLVGDIKELRSHQHYLVGVINGIVERCGSPEQKALLTNLKRRTTEKYVSDYDPCSWINLLAADFWFYQTQDHLTLLIKAKEKGRDDLNYTDLLDVTYFESKEVQSKALEILRWGPWNKAPDQNNPIYNGNSLARLAAFTQSRYDRALNLSDSLPAKTTVLFSYAGFLKKMIRSGHSQKDAPRFEEGDQQEQWIEQHRQAVIALFERLTSLKKPAETEQNLGFATRLYADHAFGRLGFAMADLLQASIEVLIAFYEQKKSLRSNLERIEQVYAAGLLALSHWCWFYQGEQETTPYAAPLVAFYLAKNHDHWLDLLEQDIPTQDTLVRLRPLLVYQSKINPFEPRNSKRVIDYMDGNFPKLLSNCQLNTEMEWENLRKIKLDLGNPLPLSFKEYAGYDNKRRQDIDEYLWEGFYTNFIDSMLKVIAPNKVDSGILNWGDDLADPPMPKTVDDDLNHHLFSNLTLYLTKAATIYGTWATDDVTTPFEADQADLTTPSASKETPY